MAMQSGMAVRDEHISVRTSTNGEFFNAYDILNLEDLRWSVATYTVVHLDDSSRKHEDRGKIKDVIWRLRDQYRGSCRGYGFVIDVDEVTVAVPSTWNIPRQENFDGYRVVLDRVFNVEAAEPEHGVIVADILKESIKRHFKDSYSDEIGPLWQDYGDFCQLPAMTAADQNVVFCRKFHIAPERLQGGRWVIKMEVSTTGLDVRTCGDYYRFGEVQRLADLIRMKQANRLTRKNEPIAVRVWYGRGRGADVLELERPEQILEHALLDPIDQKALGGQTVPCKQFNKPLLEVPLDKIRMILDTQITQEDHSETIISPDERAEWYGVLRDFFNEMDAYGKAIGLATNPTPVDAFDTLLIMPPVLCVRTSPDRISHLSAPEEPTAEALARRARLRADYVRRHGYLERRPINPLLACPKQFGEKRARRVRSDLNWILERQGLDFRFGDPLIYDTVQDIVRAIEGDAYDTLFAVLPEGSWVPESDTDTHEQIKRRIAVPSQCIHHDNTLPLKWVEQRPRNFRDADPRGARRIEERYRQCLLNLVVKHHWVPFAPAEPFHYNVHIGIDVGGKHNNRVMACVGYGFLQPSKGLIFLPWQVDIDIQQVEPIPTNYLYEGLCSMFEELYSRLIDAKVSPDFNKVLFFRDGELRGKGDIWNEIDALVHLRQELYRRQWTGDDALWTATEISKRARYWRLLHKMDTVVDNPIVGRCVFPFVDTDTSIVCTTGRPYLSQGTASPLLVRIRNIYRQAHREEVLRDLIWEADMCFTKVDLGMSLPWVLHVANSGALQLSRAYYITGITV
jgi:hypothetical protein